MFTIFLTIFILFAVIGFIYKIVMKRRMRRALGRSVEDHELTSLNSWMEVTENEERDKNQRP